MITRFAVWNMSADLTQRGIPWMKKHCKIITVPAFISGFEQINPEMISIKTDKMPMKLNW